MVHTSSLAMLWLIFAAVSLTSLPSEQVDWAEFGSMLFIRHVSGTRWAVWVCTSKLLWSQPCALAGIHAVITLDLPCPLSGCWHVWYVLWKSGYFSARVVVPGTVKGIGPHTFANWGAHYDGYPCAYFTAAAAIGMKQEEVDVFIRRLDQVFTKFKNKHRPKVAGLDQPTEVSSEGGGVEKESDRATFGDEGGVITPSESAVKA